MSLLKKPLFCILLIVFSVAVKSQTADEIVNRYISFIGGGKNWHDVNTMTVSGTYNYVGVSFPFTSQAKRPDLYKYTVTANGKSFVQAYDGKEGWRIDGFKDEKEKTILKDRRATAMANEADVEIESPFINYRQKGHAVQLEGRDTIAGSPAFRIRLTRKNGQNETYFFNSNDYSLVKKKTLSTNDEMENAPLDVEYSNYNSVGKIKIPYSVAYSTNGQPVLKVSVEQVQLNLPVSNEIFAR